MCDNFEQIPVVDLRVIEEVRLGFLKPEWIKMNVCNNNKNYPFRGDALVVERCSRYKKQNSNCKKLI
jgi:hypothetical protein